MPDSKTDAMFWVGLSATASLAVMIVLDTIAVVEQSWRLGIAATGGWLAFIVLLVVVSAVVKHAIDKRATNVQAFVDQVEESKAALAEQVEHGRWALTEDSRPPCLKPVEKGYDHPDPCLLYKGHDGRCQP